MPDPRPRKRAARTARKQPPTPLAPTPSSPPPPLAAQAPALDAAARERWRSAAVALAPEQVTFGPSVRILLDEAPRVARFVERYWAPAADGGAGAQPTPGLKGASRRVPRSVAGEIMALHALTQEAHGRWLLASGGRAVSPDARGWFVLGELRATLEFLAEEATEADLTAQLARVRDAHAQDGESREDLASSLDDHAAVARLYEDEMNGVGGFDRAMIAEAAHLAAALRARPDAHLEAAGDARQKIDLRNRYAALLFDRVAAVRSVARFVFRHHPTIAREATSAWERNRRAASRRKKKTEKPAEPK